ncbi:MAG: UDP-N-acetylmuramate--L-alanine ligase [Bacillota bacterium]|nr:UDP-N-acetylmuramate--L-alanine ligase [Bacillota bacterium]
MTLPSDIKDVYFIGIGGYGMSALAQILLQKGYRVSGSDLKASPLTEDLAARGAAIFIGHHPANLGSAGLVVYSTAIAPDNPEMKEAARRGLPLWHRSELLADLLNSSFGIAVAGAHGKTTTTAMIALLLEAAGLDPTAVIGGVLPAYGRNARLGSGPYLVAEADESDSSFTRYFPRLILVTGIEPDHLEHYNNDYGKLLQAYEKFLHNLPPEGTAVLCFDDPALREMACRLECRVVSYGLTTRADWPVDYAAGKITFQGSGSQFNLTRYSSPCASAITLNIPGRHNISNAVGALALADCLGIDPASCSPALASFNGVKRRFERIGTAGDISVIDDYAHHPTEVKSTLEAARLAGSRIICLFQPHRYSRTAARFDGFASAFSGADYLFLHDIYGAGEEPLPGISAETLAEAIRSRSRIPVVYNSDIKALEKEAAALARPGDLIITMGAGDVTAAAPRILELLKEKK